MLPHHRGRSSSGDELQNRTFEPNDSKSKGIRGYYGFFATFGLPLEYEILIMGQTHVKQAYGRLFS